MPVIGVAPRGGWYGSFWTLWEEPEDEDEDSGAAHISAVHGEYGDYRSDVFAALCGAEVHAEIYPEGHLNHISCQDCKDALSEHIRSLPQENQTYREASSFYPDRGGRWDSHTQDAHGNHQVGVSHYGSIIIPDSSYAEWESTPRVEQRQAALISGLLERGSFLPFTPLVYYRRGTARTGFRLVSVDNPGENTTGI